MYLVGGVLPDRRLYSTSSSSSSADDKETALSAINCTSSSPSSLPSPSSPPPALTCCCWCPSPGKQHSQLPAAPLPALAKAPMTDMSTLLPFFFLPFAVIIARIASLLSLSPAVSKEGREVAASSCISDDDDDNDDDDVEETVAAGLKKASSVLAEASTRTRR